MLLVTFFACPFCILPVKDSIEEITCKKGETLSKKSNIIWTFILSTIALAVALTVPNISDAMTILGATTNSGIGFLLPIHFYFKTQKDNKKITNMKIMCIIIYVVICISSAITMVDFVKTKMEPKKK
jgi:amino acid permease